MAGMRGTDFQQSAMFSYLSPEQRVPADHPLRAIRQITDKVLRRLSRLFSRMYSQVGRPSIPPEKLLRALLLQALYTIRSERMLMEELNYNLLFRWFVGLNLDDEVWDVTVFTKNRERLLKAEVARRFFHLVVEEARGLELMSDEHFTVDGTLLEACASLKSFKKVEEGGDSGGPAERDAVLVMMEAIPGEQPVTVGADKAYDTQDFVAEARHLKVTPHVAQNNKRRKSAIDGRTTRHGGYAISQRKRKRVEEIFGWLKTVGGMRKLRHRGMELVGWMFTLAAAAYNLVRIRNLATAIPAGSV